MTDAVRTWLVERTYTDRDLVVLTYATPDGRRAYTRELSSSILNRTTVTAATEVAPDRLRPVPEPDRERYAAEAARVRDSRRPDEEI